MLRISVLLFLFIFYCEIKGSYSWCDDLQAALCINNQSMSDLSNYNYFAFEVVHVTCPFFSKEELILTATDGKYVTSGAGPRGLLIKLLQKHDNYCFDCSHGEVFLRLGGDIPEDHIIVNGIALRPQRSFYFLQEENEHLVLKFNKKYKSIILNIGDKGTLSRESWIDQVFEIIPDNNTLHTYNITVLSNERSKTYKTFLLDVVPSVFVFDPSITGLKVSNILSKYALPNVNIINYELDYETDDFTFGCSSSHGIVNVNGKKSKRLITENKWTSHTINGSKTYYRRMNCSVVVNDTVLSTILLITRSQKLDLTIPPKADNTPTKVARFHDKETDKANAIEATTTTTNTNEENIDTRATNEDNTPTKARSKDEETDKANAIEATTTETNTNEENIATRATNEVADHPDSSLFAVAPSNKILIGSNLATMFLTAVIMGVVFTSAKDEAVDISKRAQLPAPLDEEENKKYIHYDTPYDHRFDRRGPSNFHQRAEQTRN